MMGLHQESFKLETRGGDVVGYQRSASNWSCGPQEVTHSHESIDDEVYSHKTHVEMKEVGLL